ncbi:MULTISPECIES: hypothetical protein [Glycomyces]|uniref:Uncharacterized protein n=2 Tax=Glycomyces TaxID=58113 RepID=A0A9X3PP94_9ACTN|nr:hypothetical protein [Glycomyces lechevalierae]MDA1387581.1 hypothetical protein [Glycomyces lechevalierae]MDR7336653.1 hypothetical protein [Glycomyces lechevalierae]
MDRYWVRVSYRSDSWETTVWAVDDDRAKQAAFMVFKNHFPATRATRWENCSYLYENLSRTGGMTLRGAGGVAGGTGTTAAQQAFSDELEGKIGDFLGTKLDGKFSTVSYPAGFNYGITYGPNAYYNAATLQDLDSLLGTSSSGQLQIGTDRFSTLYRNVLGATVFGFSKADQEMMNKEDTAASAQIGSILTEFSNAGFTYTNPLPMGGKLQDVFDQLLTRYGSFEDMPDSLIALYSAIASYKEVAANSILLHRKYFEATALLKAARSNIIQANAANGGEEIGPGQFYVGYTPDKLPSANQLIGQLQTDGNAVSLHLELSNFSSKSTDLSVGGKVGFSVPIMDAVGINFGASSSYDLSTYTSSSSTVTIDLNYKGVTIISSAPTALAPDGTVGWYDGQILSEIASKTGQDATGYQLHGSEFSVDELFGEGGKLSRLKTFVVSRQPEMSMTFKGGNASKVTSDMKVGATASVDLFGLFRVGSASSNYSVNKVDTSSSDGSVTVTFGAPEPSGTIPLAQQVAYVMGGVPSYPPNEP